MSVQLCKNLCGLSRFGCLNIVTQYVSRPLHMQCALLNDEKASNLKSTGTTATFVPDEQQKKQGQTKDNPYLVASYTDKIIVGCNCSPEDTTLKWFYLQDGPPQVCECGIYFKLDKIDKGNWIPEYSRIMQVDKFKPDPRRERRGLPFIGDKPPPPKPFIKQKAN